MISIIFKVLILIITLVIEASGRFGNNGGSRDNRNGNHNRRGSSRGRVFASCIQNLIK